MLRCFDALGPTSGLSTAITTLSLALRLGLVESEDRFNSEQAKRLPRAIRRNGEAEVPEETLARIDEPAEPFADHRPVKLELASVVNDEHALVPSGSLGRLSKVRGQDRLRRNALVAEEPISRLELGVVERLRKALGRPVDDACHQRRQTLGQANIAKVGISDLVSNGRNSSYASRHPATGSWPTIPRKMCRIMRAGYSLSSASTNADDAIGLAS